MSIRRLEKQAAVARLSALRLKCSVEEAAATLVQWEAGRNSLLVPRQVALRELAAERSTAQDTAEFYKNRARMVRIAIAKELKLDAKSAAKLTFTMTYKDAWYLGPRPNLDASAMLAAVKATPAKFIELMLLKELIEAAAVGVNDTFVIGGFGPGVYLGSMSQASKKRLHLAESRFLIDAKHALVRCQISSKVFLKKANGAGDTPSSITRAVDSGEGYMVGVTRIVPDDYFELDARHHPMVGVSLQVTKIRQSRLYYLNVLTEFAEALFRKAGVPTERETFTATHCVDDAYVPLQPLANLRRPLIVVNATSQPMDISSLAPLSRFNDYFAGGYHVAGNRKVHFEAPVVQMADSPPESLDPTLNYLFLNGTPEGDAGSVRIAKQGKELHFQHVRTWTAYSALADGDVVADPYTQSKYRHLMAQDTMSVAMQGLNYGPSAIESLRTASEDQASRQLRESIKRCFVELSLKEALLGHRAIPIPATNVGPLALTLLATRQIRMGRKQRPKQLISVVDVRVEAGTITTERIRRTPWKNDAVAVIDFIGEYPFVQENGKEGIRDGRFWVVDKATGERLTVWFGDFVPKLILNDRYETIEAALAAQGKHLEAGRQQGSGGRYYSKARAFNLLPYYMSMYDSGGRGAERVGTRIAVQDRGSFIRIFVPPEGGINGSGDALSAMRDVMFYEADGREVQSELLNRPLVQLYIHTMTNGLLVGGDNSKMSVLEKLARLALEN